MPTDWKLKTLDAEKVTSLQPGRLFDLTGKVAVVTGAGGGLGAWLSAGLAAAGAKLLLTDHPKTPMTKTAAAIKVAGGTVDEYECDLLEEGAPEKIIQAAVDRLGSVDVLVNNAGVNRREEIFDVSRESWDFISTINLRVPYELSRAAAKIIAERSGGSSVHIGSLNNAIGLAGSFITGRTLYVEGGWLAGTPWSEGGSASTNA